jgi:hypothetical protein
VSQQPTYIEQVLIQIPPYNGEKPNGAGDVFRDYLKRINKFQSFMRMKKALIEKAKEPKNTAWIRAAKRLGWFEFWSEKTAKELLESRCAAGELVGHKLYELPMNQWQAFVWQANTLDLPNPLPYIPKVGVELPTEVKDKIALEKAIQTEMAKSADPVADIDWAWNNCGREGLNLLDCPSGNAYNFWCIGRDSKKTLMEMWTKFVLAPATKGDPELAKKRKALEVDRLQKFEVIDRLLERV